MMDALAVRAIRIKNGLSRGDFAKKLGVSVSAIAMIECGKRRVTENMKLRILQNFDVDSDLLDIIHRAKMFNTIS